MDPRGLLLKTLGELLTIEQTLAREVLPKLRDRVHEKHFRESVDEHIEQTHGHVANVRKAFAELGAKAQEQPSPALEALRLQHERTASELNRPPLQDLWHASAAAHVEHLEISTYHGAITLASTLGEPEAVRLLEQNLHEDEETLEKLERSIPERLVGELAPAS